MRITFSIAAPTLFIVGIITGSSSPVTAVNNIFAHKNGLKNGDDHGLVDFGFAGVEISQDSIPEKCQTDWEAFYSGCVVKSCPNFNDACPEITQEEGQGSSTTQDSGGQEEGGTGSGGSTSGGQGSSTTQDSGGQAEGGPGSGGSTGNGEESGSTQDSGGQAEGGPGSTGSGQASSSTVESGGPGNGASGGGGRPSQGGGSGSGKGQGGENRRLQPPEGSTAGEDGVQCISDIPTDNTNAVEISIYRNDQGGTLGDDCPVSCDGDPIKVQYYAIADSNNQCFQWPGSAGENSMKSGTCHTEDQSYTFDQWTNCECDGEVGNSKDAFVDKCVVDMPTSLCAKITDYSACESSSTGATETTEAQPDPETGAGDTSATSTGADDQEDTSGTSTGADGGQCISDIPTDNTNAVEISIYRNDQGGTLGDDCPVSCDGEPIKVQYYAIADSNNQCFQWPGSAGENSMKSGTCHTEDQSYTFDQWTNCECDGEVGNSKDAFVDKCVVDMPTSLCAKITDYSACESSSTGTTTLATTDLPPGADTGTSEEVPSCGDLAVGFCETYGTEGCCIQSCSSELGALMQCVIRETTSEPLGDCDTFSCPATTTAEQEGTTRGLEGFELEVAGIQINSGGNDTASTCVKEWDALADNVLMECSNFKDVCPSLGSGPKKNATGSGPPVLTCSEFEPKVCKVLDFRLNDPECCLETASKEIYDLLICTIQHNTGQDLSECIRPECLANVVGTTVSVNSSFLISTLEGLSAANLKEQNKNGNSTDVKLLTMAYVMLVEAVVDTIVASQGGQRRHLGGPSFSTSTGGLRQLQKQPPRLDAQSVQIYDLVDTPCDVMDVAINKQAETGSGGGIKTCITVFGKYSIIVDPDGGVGAEEVYDNFVQKTTSAIASGKLQETLQQVQTHNNTTLSFVVEGISPTVDMNHVPIITATGNASASPTNSPTVPNASITPAPVTSDNTTMPPTEEPTQSSAGKGGLQNIGVLLLAYVFASGVYHFLAF